MSRSQTQYSTVFVVATNNICLTQNVKTKIQRPYLGVRTSTFKVRGYDIPHAVHHSRRVTPTTVNFNESTYLHFPRSTAFAINPFFKLPYLYYHHLFSSLFHILQDVNLSTNQQDFKNSHNLQPMAVLFYTAASTSVLLQPFQVFFSTGKTFHEHLFSVYDQLLIQHAVNCLLFL